MCYNRCICDYILFRKSGIDAGRYTYRMEANNKTEVTRYSAAVRTEFQHQAVNIMSKAPFYAVAIFLASPLIQLIKRIFTWTSVDWEDYYNDLYTYHDTSDKVNIIAAILALFGYFFVIMHFKRKQDEMPAILKRNWKRFIPIVLMWLFAIAILNASLLNGMVGYDLRGHTYMHESIFSFMLYPVGYFFCGAMMRKSSQKRKLLYLLLFSSVPLALLTLYDEWFDRIPIFIGEGVAAVFHQFNHYGYYLMMVTISAAGLFVYEKEKKWKLISAGIGLLNAFILIMNDTFGTYLAVAFVLIALTVHCLIRERRYLKWALMALGSFALLTILMSFAYDTVFSSFLKLFRDVSDIASNSEEIGDIGSGRWVLWTQTMSHLWDSPFIGFGVEGMLRIYNVGTPHNELMQYSANFGIPAMLLYFSSVMIILFTVLRRYKRFSKMTLICFCAAVGYFCNSMVAVTIYYTTPFFYIFLGMAYAEYLHGGFND